MQLLGEWLLVEAAQVPRARARGPAEVVRLLLFDLRPSELLALLRKSDDLAMAVEQVCDALDAFECAAAAHEGADRGEAAGVVRAVQAAPHSQLRAQAREFVPARLIFGSLMQPVMEQLAGAVQLATTLAIFSAQVRAAVEGVCHAGSGGRQRRSRRARRFVRQLGCSRPAFVGLGAAAALFDAAARAHGWLQSEVSSDCEDYFSAEEDAVWRG
jgi:hypothetical protein